MQTPAATHTFSHQQNAILTSLSRGANRARACHAADLPRRTFYNWIKADPAFSEAVAEAEAESICVAEDLAYECAMKAGEDPRYLRALFFWLKHRAGWIQARPDPVPSSAAPSSSTPQPTPPPAHSVRATDSVALPSGDGTPEENPAPGVPSVPSKLSAISAKQSSSDSSHPPTTHAESTRTSSLLTRTSNEPSPNPQPPKSSRQRDKLRMQQFRRKHRR